MLKENLLAHQLRKADLFLSRKLIVILIALCMLLFSVEAVQGDEVQFYVIHYDGNGTSCSNVTP